MSRYGHFMKFCDKNGQNYHKMTISCVYELGGYLDNVLAELDQSGFCIATYLKEMLVEYWAGSSSRGASRPAEECELCGRYQHTEGGGRGVLCPV